MEVYTCSSAYLATTRTYEATRRIVTFMSTMDHKRGVSNQANLSVMCVSMIRSVLYYVQYPSSLIICTIFSMCTERKKRLAANNRKVSSPRDIFVNRQKDQSGTLASPWKTARISNLFLLPITDPYVERWMRELFSPVLLANGGTASYALCLLLHPPKSKSYMCINLLKFWNLLCGQSPYVRQQALQCSKGFLHNYIL